MTTHDRTKTILTLATLALLGAAPLAAQEKISIKFAGGKLSALLEQIRAAGDEVNIIASPLADEVTLPAMTLKNAGVYAALQAVGRIVTPPYQANVAEQSDRSSGQPVYSVSVYRMPAQQAQGTVGPGDYKDVRVFSLKNLTDAVPGLPEAEGMKMSARTILSAIDTGLAVTEADAATIRYHEDSGLLFVHGTGAQTRLVEQTLSNLERDLYRQRQAAQGSGRPTGPSTPGPSEPSSGAKKDGE